uniref:Uncharacterized protein n=1 Tax=Oncorhynchus tshawytscha TaxID=74940 RepID=A0AAZ3PQX9_ONCTS
MDLGTEHSHLVESTMGPEGPSMTFFNAEYGFGWKVTMLVLSSLALVLGTVMLLLNIHDNRTMTQHTSRLCTGYLTKKESDGVLHQMAWPPQSPDLNPNEMVWVELDLRVKEKQPTSAQDSFKTVGK